jgi:hypothetical protein
MKKKIYHQLHRTISFSQTEMGGLLRVFFLGYIGWARFHLIFSLFIGQIVGLAGKGVGAEQTIALRCMMSAFWCCCWCWSFNALWLPV